MAVTSVASNPLDAIAAATSSSGKTSSSAATDTVSATDRFLKLLVTQMQNQDPLNPMDNAQVTSQMAQISTVSGIQDLNTTVSGLNAQFTQLQAVQGASLVGHDVTLQGNRLDTSTTDGSGLGGFELSSAASSVKVTVKDGSSRIVDTLDLGAQPAGMNGFAWTKPIAGQNYSFVVEAQANGTALNATPLMRDHINAVSIVNGKLTLQTSYSGPVDYTTVKAVN
jgi:flagellar basal-body rod modification protein FlgD